LFQNGLQPISKDAYRRSHVRLTTHKHHPKASLVIQLISNHLPQATIVFMKMITSGSCIYAWHHYHTKYDLIIHTLHAFSPSIIY